MSAEFRPSKPAEYKEATVWTDNTEVKNVRIFTQDLAYDVDTRPFQPYLVQAERKYAILTDIKVIPGGIELHAQTKIPHKLKISNANIELRGLPVAVIDKDAIARSGVIFSKK